MKLAEERIPRDVLDGIAANATGVVFPLEGLMMSVCSVVLRLNVRIRLIVRGLGVKIYCASMTSVSPVLMKVKHAERISWAAAQI